VSEPEVQRILLHSDGPALWPERYDAASLAAIQNTVGGYFFESLYQGNPRPKGGLMFRREWFASRVSGVPRGSTFCRFWDKAASQGKGDWTVGTLMARDPEGRFTVVNVVRARLSRPATSPSSTDPGSRTGSTSWKPSPTASSTTRWTPRRAPSITSPGPSRPAGAGPRWPGSTHSAPADTPVDSPIN
jgi:hypothetical protein